MRRAALALAVVVGFVDLGHAGGEWRTYAGGPRRLFFNPDETQITAATVGGLRRKWTFPTNAVITGSPSVAEVNLPGEGPTQVVYFQSWDHTLYAVRLHDGSEVWRFVTPDHPTSTFPNAGSVDVTKVLGQDRVFFASEQTLFALDARDGTEAWRFDAGTGCRVPPGLCDFEGERNQIESSPIVAGDVVVFGMDVDDREGGKGGMYGVDVEDGHLVWFFDLESGMTCHPNPGDDVRRYDGYHSEAELGLPPGFFATRAGCDHPRTPNGCGNVWSSAAWDAGRDRLFIASSNCDTDANPMTLIPPPPMPPYDEAIFALDGDGNAVWRWRAREVDADDLAYGAVPNLFTIDVGGGTFRDVVGIGNKDGTYTVIDRDGVNVSNGVAWSDVDPSLLPYWRTSVVPGGAIGGIIATASVDEASRRVVVSTAPGMSVFSPQRPTVHGLDLDTGAIVWTNAAETTADASFAPTSGIPGVVFVGSVIGAVVRAYDATSGVRLWDDIHLGSVTMASAPAVVDGMVLVGTGSGQQGPDPMAVADMTSRYPSPLYAYCVSGSLACDADQDGADFPEDCDDADPLRGPNAREIADDTIDQDCDGLLAYSSDPCLELGSAGQDARDLAATRAAMEVSCPCAAFDGSQARTSSFYRACIRPVLGTALKNGTVRKVCKTLLSESTCGRRPAANVCCTTKLSGRRGCRVIPADRCMPSPAMHREACAASATHCMDAACVPHGVCTLP